MSSNENPRHLTLSELQERCTQETDNYFQNLADEAWHCYEIFRRAIVEKSNEAWEIIVNQYQNQVIRWVMYHPKFHLFSEEANFFANRVFEKFWRRDLSAKDFSRFPNVKSLMGYIKTCVASVMTDYWRVQDRKQIEYLAELPRPEPQVDGFSIEDEVVDRMQRSHFLSHLRRYLPDEKEYQVVYASFVLGFKPVEVFNHIPHVFEDVQEVYKIKAKAISRLRRDIGFLSQFTNNSGEIE